MLDSLLVNVSKYASSANHSPVENFITEVFAWLLRSDVSLRSSLLALLKARVGESLGANSVARELVEYQVSDTVAIATQMNFAGVYPDMVWQDHQQLWTLVFEHKVWSELSDQQLAHYRAYAEAHFPQYALILITARRSQHKQNPDIALCWQDIADSINQLPSTDEQQQWLRQEFIALLEHHSLLNDMPINPLSLAYYQDAIKLDQQLANICEAALRHQWPLAALPYFELKTKVDKQWGRVGLVFNAPKRNPSLYEAWEPGVFCGFMKDPADHVLHDLLEQGPIAVMIISLDRSLHYGIGQNLCYQQLVSALAKVLPSGWEISDRTQYAGYNSWHPLVIYAELPPLLQGCKTAELQEIRVIEQLDKLQHLLISLPEFEAFCIDMRNRYAANSMV